MPAFGVSQHPLFALYFILALCGTTMRLQLSRRSRCLVPWYLVPGMWYCLALFLPGAMGSPSVLVISLPFPCVLAAVPPFHFTCFIPSGRFFSLFRDHAGVQGAELYRENIVTIIVYFGE